MLRYEICLLRPAGLGLETAQSRIYKSCYASTHDAPFKFDTNTESL